MRSFIVASVAALLGLATCGPIAVKRRDDCADEASTQVADAIRAVSVTSELPMYPGGYQPLPYGPPPTSSASANISVPPFSTSVSITTAPGIPSSSEAGGITAFAPSESSSTGSNSVESSTAISETSQHITTTIYATPINSSSTAGPTEIAPTSTMETITVSVNTSTPPYTGSPYTPWAGNDTSSGFGSTVPGTGLPQRPPGGSFFTGVTTTSVTSVFTISLTKTVETTIYPPASSAGPVNSNKSSLSSPMTGTGATTTTSTSSKIIIITISPAPSSGTGTAPYSFSTPPGSAPPYPYSYNYSSPLPTGPPSSGTGGTASSVCCTGPSSGPSSGAGPGTAPAPYPYSYSYTWTATGGTAVSGGFSTYTNASSAGQTTGGTTPAISTTTLTETLTSTIASGLPRPPKPFQSSSSSLGSSVLTTIYSESTSYSTVTETISISIITSTSKSWSNPSAGLSGSLGSPINTSNSTSAATSSTSLGGYYPYGGYSPLPVPIASSSPTAVTSEQVSADPNTATDPVGTTVTPTNTPYPVPSYSAGGHGISYMPPLDDMPKASSWWAAIMEWWHGKAGRRGKHGHKKGKGRGSIPSVRSSNTQMA